MAVYSLMSGSQEEGQEVIASDYIRIFPAARRDYLYQKDSRLFNEKNVVNIINRLTDVDNYVVTTGTLYTGCPFEFVIHGYDIMIPDIDKLIQLVQSESPRYLYAYIEIDTGNEFEEIAGQDDDDGTYVTTGVHVIRYYGVKFSSTIPVGSNTYYLKILEKIDSTGQFILSNLQIPSQSLVKFDQSTMQGLPKLQSDFDTHSEDTDIHITATERLTWNATTAAEGILRGEFDTHNADAVRHITGQERTAWNTASSGNSKTLNTRTATLTAANWTQVIANAQYTYTLSGLTGVTATDVPQIGLDIAAANYASAKNIRKGFGFIYRAETGTDQIVFYAYKKPVVDIPILIKGA